jgi:gamma-glutamyltranspeptidase/glutathione hydrolase
LPLTWNPVMGTGRLVQGSAGGGCVTAMAAMKRMCSGVIAVALSVSLSACETLNSVQQEFLGGGVSGPGSQPKRISGFIGGVVADEPTATLAGREVLSLGGTAADAAVAIGFTLSVTYPSRASLGAGGACLAYSPARTGAGEGTPEAIVFTSVAPGTVPPRTDRPAAVPMLARGLFALHARYGRRPFETLVAPAEQLARFGTPASRALVRDLQVVSGPLLADPDARAVFAPNGTVLTEGVTMIQPDLGATLAQLRVAGVGDLYQGALAAKFQAAATAAGGGMSAADLRGALPKTVSPLFLASGRDRVAFLPPPADGGLAAAAAYETLLSNPANLAAANERALAVAARYRAGGADPASLLGAGAAIPSGAPLPALPASTTFATLDRDGNAVVCALTMNNLFGTGRIASGTGIVMAASPASTPPALLAAAIAWNPNLRAFHAEVGGSGQAGAPLATAAGLSNAIRSGTAIPVPVPDPGRENAIVCARYLPDSEGTCGWATDSRGSGLAAGGN